MQRLFCFVVFPFLFRSFRRKIQRFVWPLLVFPCLESWSQFSHNPYDNGYPCQNKVNFSKPEHQSIFPVSKRPISVKLELQQTPYHCWMLEIVLYQFQPKHYDFKGSSNSSHFFKSMSGRVGSDKQRQWNWIANFQIDSKSIEDESS